MKFSLAVLLCGLGLVTAPNAFADDLVNLRNRPLEKVEFWHSRPRLGIEDTSPILIDWRKSTPQTTYKIVIPPAPKSTNQEVILTAPSPVDNSSNLVSNRPLAPAAFNTNINPNRARANSLPQGNSVGQHVVGNLLTPPKPAKALPVRHALNEPAPSTPTKALTYQTTPTHASTSQQFLSAAHVKGELLKSK
jgi:hypothetical protein